MTSAFKYLSPYSSVGIETAFPRTSGKTEVFRTWEKFMGKEKLDNIQFSSNTLWVTSLVETMDI